MPYDNLRVIISRLNVFAQKKTSCLIMKTIDAVIIAKLSVRKCVLFKEASFCVFCQGKLRDIQDTRLNVIING